MNHRLKALANAAGAAWHMCSLVILGVAGIVSVTLLFAQADATEKKATVNAQSIEELRKTLNEVGTNQKVIIQEIEGEKKLNEQFRNGATRSLDLILQRLISRDLDDNIR